MSKKWNAVSDEIKPCRNNYLPGIIFLQQDVMTMKGIILAELYPHFIKFDVTIPSWNQFQRSRSTAIQASIDGASKTFPESSIICLNVLWQSANSQPPNPDITCNSSLSDRPYIVLITKRKKNKISRSPQWSETYVDSV